MSPVEAPVRPVVRTLPAGPHADAAALVRRLTRAGHGSRLGADGIDWPEVCTTPRSGQAFVGLLEAFRATGGTAPGDIVGRLLEDHGAGDALSLSTLIAAGRCFGFEWRAVLWIPMFQFDADKLTLKDGSAQVQGALPSGWNGWTRACWLTLPNARLAGRRPVDMLETDLAEVRRCACRLGSDHRLGQEGTP